MTKEEILDAIKELHYSEKLAIAQSLILMARKDLEQITSQFQPMPQKVFSQAPLDETKTNDSVPITTKNELTLDDIIERLKKLKCKKEKTMINSIMAMYQFRGGITEENAKKLIQKLLARKTISITDNGSIKWNE